MAGGRIVAERDPREYLRHVRGETRTARAGLPHLVEARRRGRSAERPAVPRRGARGRRHELAGRHLAVPAGSASGCSRWARRSRPRWWSRYFVLGEYTQRSRVAGQLVPNLGVSTVVAPTSGVVGRLFVERGRQARRPAPQLVSIDVPRTTAVRPRLAPRAARRASTRAGPAWPSRASAQGSSSTPRSSRLPGQLPPRGRSCVRSSARSRTRRKQVKLGRSILARYERVADEST